MEAFHTKGTHALRYKNVNEPGIFKQRESMPEHGFL